MANPRSKTALLRLKKKQAKGGKGGRKRKPRSAASKGMRRRYGRACKSTSSSNRNAAIVIKEGRAKTPECKALVKSIRAARLRRHKGASTGVVSGRKREIAGAAEKARVTPPFPRRSPVSPVPPNACINRLCHPPSSCSS